MVDTVRMVWSNDVSFKQLINPIYDDFVLNMKFQDLIIYSVTNKIEMNIINCGKSLHCYYIPFNCCFLDMYNLYFSMKNLHYLGLTWA